ncbi:aminoacyl-tRNA deacylase [Arenivirga flava]|nr:YbaK/EbsC family protein [Arenivirga flava]
MSMGRAEADAAERGLEIEIVERGPAGSLEEAAARLGVAPPEIVKTLVVKGRDGFWFALVPGDRQISWPKLRAAIGVNKLQLPPAEQAFEATGYERGTIVPLGSTTAWPVFADASIRGRIAMGAGWHGASLLVESADLIRSLEATVADICTEPEG